MFFKKYKIANTPSLKRRHESIHTIVQAPDLKNKEANRCDRYRRQQIKEQRTTMTGRGLLLKIGVDKKAYIGYNNNEAATYGLPYPQAS